MKNSTKFILIIIFFQSALLFAQESSADDLDFWVGDWNVQWIDSSGTVHKGTNKIEKILDEKVISENFSGEGFEGKSYSVFNERNKIWQQTWVDNNSSYLDFTGGKVGDKFILSMDKKNPKGNHIKLRMVFYNITSNEFSWDWERSANNGETWKLLWRLNYTRE